MGQEWAWEDMGDGTCACCRKVVYMKEVDENTDGRTDRYTRFGIRLDRFAQGI